MRGILPFLVILLAVAFFTKADFFFYLLYALFGIYALGRAWARSSLGAVSLERRFDRRLFLGQTAPIELRIHNRGWLPVLWLRLTDSLPAKLAPAQRFAPCRLAPAPRTPAAWRIPSMLATEATIRSAPCWLPVEICSARGRSTARRSRTTL
jgi:hypothetical protein